MIIDFWDPDITSPPPATPLPDNFPRHFSPDISLSNLLIFCGKEVKDLYLLLRAHI